MLSKWVLLLLIIVSANTLAGKAAIEIIEQFDDFKVVAFVNEADIEDYPVWQSLVDTPPLPVNEAIRLVQGHLGEVGKSAETDVIKEIELREIPRHPNYWHYLVKTENNDFGPSRYGIYVVLMSGKIIPAIVEPDAFK